MALLISALTIGAILSLLALGVYISFRIFAFPDITADGSFALGAAVTAVCAIAGMNPWLAIGLVFLAGMTAGATTGIMHTKYKINGLLAGILVMTALYSINLRVMGKSNIPILNSPTQLSTQSIKKPAVLADRLQAGDDALSKYLKTKLSANTLEGLQSYAKDVEKDPKTARKAFPESLTRRLTNDLNRVISGPILFEEDRCADVKLSRATAELLATQPVGEDLAKLNRMLIDDAYPRTIKRFCEIRSLSREAESAAAFAFGGQESTDVFGWNVDVNDIAHLLGGFLVVLLVGSLLYAFLLTNLGTAMRATGDNHDMIRALGVNVETMIVFGLALSNGLIAVSGALFAQHSGFADVQMGIGMIVAGLASVIIGEALVGKSSLGLTIVGVVMGSVLFRLLIAIALRWGMNPNDQKLVQAVFVFVALVLPMFLAGVRKKVRTAHA